MKQLYLTLQSKDPYQAPYWEIKVASLKEAGIRLREWVEEFDLGASQLGPKCGNVYCGQSPIPIALISYNGRSWQYSSIGKTSGELIELTDADLGIKETI